MAFLDPIKRLLEPLAKLFIRCSGSLLQLDYLDFQSKILIHYFFFSRRLISLFDGLNSSLASTDIAFSMTSYMRLTGYDTLSEDASEYLGLSFSSS